MVLVVGKKAKMDMKELIEHDDGFNYWLKTDHGREGNAKKVEQKILRELDKFQCFK